MKKQEDSELSKTIQQILDLIKEPLQEQKEGIENIKKDISKHHQQIFPDLSIDFDIKMAEPTIKMSDLLYKGSTIKFKEGSTDVNWSQQGTGSQRALFWSLMQVRSKLQALIEMRKLKIQEEKDLKTQLDKVIKNRAKLIKGPAIEKANLQITEIEMKIKNLESTGGTEDSDISLPGYMLLIDEPEVGLHPNAIRAACKYLYELSDDPNWQVMITTHSPIFVDPTRDNTTIVRLDRKSENPTPRIYITDNVKYTEDEKTTLKMINRYDTTLAEMFFGQYPIIVEGDTEYTAFENIMSLEFEKYSISQKPIIFRARGKWIIPILIKMLTHFKIDFSVLFDSDTPFTSKGNKNSVWKANFKIFAEIKNAVDKGLKVIYRISVPNFECQHLVKDSTELELLKEIPEKVKPWKMYEEIIAKHGVKDSVEKILNELLICKDVSNITEDEFKKYIFGNIQEWGKKYDKDNLILYFGKDKKEK